jgi:hypothetical protein
MEEEKSLQAIIKEQEEILQYAQEKKKTSKTQSIFKH